MSTETSFKNSAHKDANFNSSLRFVSLGIDTQQEHFVFLKSNSAIVISEGFETLTRLLISSGDQSIVGTLSTIESDLIQDGEASLSTSASEKLGIQAGDTIHLAHLPPLKSLALVRSKLHGKRLNQEQFSQIITDIEQGNYSNIHVASFITACYGDNLSIEEITFLTRAMVGTGKVLKWNQPVVVDKHCIGGLPGNRTTPIVVALVAAHGLTIPKTSSRAITSPAGTADTMSVIAPVDLSLEHIQEVIKAENGCISWGSAAGLSPVDDRIIRVERALNIDSEGQMIASILSKKVAVGSSHIVIDIPVGPTAKVRSEEQAQKLKYMLTVIGQAMGLTLKVLITDGTQPVGRGIGPALEAKDVIDVLKNNPMAPKDLKEKCLELAGAIFELVGQCPPAEGYKLAQKLLAEGSAWEKFQAICTAQGGMRPIPTAPYNHQVLARCSGQVSAMDNRKLARIAKLAGAPYDLSAGVELLVKVGDNVRADQVLYVVHSESKGELKYALDYISSESIIIVV